MVKNAMVYLLFNANFLAVANIGQNEINFLALTIIKRIDSIN